MPQLSKVPRDRIYSMTTHGARPNATNQMAAGNSSSHDTEGFLNKSHFALSKIERVQLPREQMTSTFGVLHLFGRDLLAADRSLRERWIDRALCYWRETGFPYPRLAADEIEREFKLVQQSPTAAAFAHGLL
jgi:hypothetical protein